MKSLEPTLRREVNERGPRTTRQAEGAFRPELEHVPCNLCGNAESTVLFVTKDFLHGLPGSFRVVRCCQCGLAYLNPRPTVTSIVHYYPSSYQPYNMLPRSEADKQSVVRSKTIGQWKELIRAYQLHAHYGYPLRTSITDPQMWILRVISKIYQYRPLGITPFVPGGRLLDVGTGSGAGLMDRQALGWQVQGVEPNAEAADRARAAGFDVFTGDLLDAKFPTASLDVVQLWWVLEHVHDPSAVLLECHRILKPRGRIVILVPNFGSPVARLLGRYWFGLEAPRHLFHFSISTLNFALTTTGFPENKYTLFTDPASIPRSIVYWAIDKGCLKESQRTLLWARGLSRLFWPMGWLVTKMGWGDSLLAVAVKE